MGEVSVVAVDGAVLGWRFVRRDSLTGWGDEVYALLISGIRNRLTVDSARQRKGFTTEGTEDTESEEIED